MKKILQILSALIIMLFVQALLIMPDNLSLKNSSENEEQFWVFNDKG